MRKNGTKPNRVKLTLPRKEMTLLETAAKDRGISLESMVHILIARDVADSKPQTETISFTVDADTARLIRACAAWEGREVNDWVRGCVLPGLEADLDQMAIHARTMTGSGCCES